MSRSDESSFADALDAIGDLGDHLAHAREVLQHGPPEPGEQRDDHEPTLLHALQVAEAAVVNMGAFAQGLRRTYAGGALALTREGHRVEVIVRGDPAQADIAAFISDLRHADQRLLDGAELLGLLLGLAARWAAASFAPPVVLGTLNKTAPRILELGAALLDLN